MSFHFLSYIESYKQSLNENVEEVLKFNIQGSVITLNR